MKTANLEKLALLGGPPVFQKEFPTYNSIGSKEIQAVDKVMKSGQLSGYYGSWSPEFMGGKKVQEFENVKLCEKFMKCRFHHFVMLSSISYPAWCVFLQNYFSLFAMLSALTVRDKIRFVFINVEEWL